MGSYTFIVRKDFSKKKLKDLLLEDSLLTEQQVLHVEDLAANQKKGFLDVLMSQGLVSDESLAVCFAKNGELPFIYLTQYAYDEDALKSWDLGFCKEHHCAVFDSKEHELWIAVFNPLDAELLEKINQQEKHINLFLSTYSDIGRVLAAISPDTAHFNATTSKLKAA